MENYNKYIINIFERYTDLKKSKKNDFDNNDLWKIFEYYSCIKLSEEYKKPFYEYDDIEPTFKELNKMTRNDTGIDCSDLLNTIVQCKLRKNTLTWKECCTFFGSQVIFSTELKKPIVRWDNLIITRNNDCTLSENLLERKELFIDKPYNKNELITFCENLIINRPEYPVFNKDFKLRDYQIEAIDIVKNNKKNIIINLPTGTGKNSVIIYSIKSDLKYLILVPRIILMEQLKNEIIKHNSKMKSKIQLIGDGNDVFDKNKLITICVFNSVHIIENQCMNFEKIFIDEAHHINKPAIYYENEYDECKSIDNINKDNNEELEEYYSDEDISVDEEYYSYNESINSDLDDDIEDELVNVKNYTKIIKSLVKYNNNVYLSATIDSIDNFEYYSKDIRNMIELKYLCDYQIHVPIFNDDPTNKNICTHILKNYRNIIIYCNSQKEGKQINKLMNELQLNSSEYIDCNTPKKKRNNIIDKYKNSEIAFLVNVRILVEGFDAPITKGVCFLHLPTNKTTLIQIIGRCLRLHPTKTIANIILPFSSKEDEKNICNFLKVIAKNDSRIKKSFKSKTLGGYISIENVEETENEDIEFKYNMIYDSMGILTNGIEIWMKRLEEVIQYIDTNLKRPSTHDKDKEIKQLGYWISNQQTNYKKKECIMKNEEIYNKWTEFIISEKYKKYFQSAEDDWNESLNQVIQYIDTNLKRPSKHDKDKKIKQLGDWLSNQQNNYNKKIYIMKNEEIYNKWTEFIISEKYKKYFQSAEYVWNESLNQVIQYIDTNLKRPSKHDKDKEIKQLGYWISHQQTNYKKKEQIMKNEEIYNKWTEFIISEKYKKYFT
jgi:DNA repair protein RadD